MSAIKRNIKQVRAFNDETRHRFILAGRRGGKTELIKEDCARSIAHCPDKGEIFYIAPTNQMAMELIWEKLIERFEQLGWAHRPLISKQCITFSRGRKIYVIGAEKIRRIRGHKVYRAYLDELAFFEVDLGQVWKAVRPALSDLRGRAVAATTPNGKGSRAYDFYLESLKNPEWRFHTWHTLDNPWIDPDEIESAKRDLDEKSFRQEYMATWESFEGLCYYNFNESLHLKRGLEITRDVPSIDILMDFNVNPTTLLVAQHVGGRLKIIKEYSEKNSSTLDTAKSFSADFKELAPHFQIKIYGDSTGSNRSHTTGRSDYFYLEEVLALNGFRFQKCITARNPHPPDRVAHVNAWLKNVLGESRIDIDVGCTDLIKDLAAQELDGRYPSGKNNLGHKADALGYYVYYKNNVEGRSLTSQTIQL